jgi:hypothetical protein
MRNMGLMRKSVHWKSMILTFGAVLMIGCSIFPSQPKAKRVFLIGIDGVGTDAFQFARTPHLNALAKDGTISLMARGVMPTVSTPIWGSILTGASPEQHGMTSNSWRKDNYSIEATVKDPDGFFPSIFTLLREQMPEAETAIFYDWDGLGNIFNHKYLNEIQLTKGYDETIDKVVPYILDKKPEFVFIYIGDPDEVGHEYNYASEEYYESIEHVDHAVGELIQTLKKEELYEESHVIVVSDHGGVGTGHGGESMTEIVVPWIMTGPGVIQNKMIEQPVNLFDTASTIAYLFGLKQPYEWIGRPVLGAFEIHREFSEMNQRAFLPKPKSSLKSGLYMEPKEISFIVDADHAEIRYTLDGSEPDMNSPVYQSPILLEKSAVLTAVSVKDGVKSIESVTDFTRIRGIKDVFLKNEPDSRYPSQGVLSLVDGQRGSNNHRDGTWMGFEEDDLEMTIDFGERRTIRKVTLGCLENEESWIFLPVSVELFISETGEYFRSAGKLIKKNRDEMAGKGINNFTREVMDLQTRYLRIKVRNIGKCPEGHPGAGRKAWLFVDEIIIE